MKRTILYGMLFALMLGLGACTKDETWSIGPLAEGEGKVSVAVDFRPLTTGLAETRTAGDAIKAIEDLSVFFYRTDGTLIKSFYLVPTTSTGADAADNDGTYKVDMPERYTEAEAAKTNYAERFTPRATFKLTVPYGRYYIYAVANMGDLANDNAYKNAVKTADGLRSIKLQWQSGENNELVKENKQMFGFFDDGGVESATPKPVTIDATRTQLHAWLRRAASKLTVAFDASKLKENVAIFIHSVQIKDIPATCYLGKKNTCGPDDELLDGEEYFYPDSPFLVDKTEDRSGLYLSNGPTVNKGGSNHAENDPVSLFFYENMQTANGNPKWQDESGQNKKITYPDSWKGPEEKDYKDDVPYGTYVEVKGYYVSDNPDRIGHGPIVYRFMLGKDVDRNYEAERNHHYQLTLQFNGYANDIDWHIEYTEPDPGVYVKTPQYISYLYDRRMTTYVKVVGQLVGNLQAEILSNHWYPDDAPSGKTASAVYYWDPSSASELQHDEHGFLSLRRSTDVVIGQSDSYSSSTNYNNYYDPTNPNRSQQKRTYVSTAGLHNSGDDADEKDGSYTVEVEDASTGHSGSSTYTFGVQLFTRSRTLTTKRGYSGNNIYMGHQRTARVRYTAKICYNGTVSDYSDFVDLHQVRRLGNPKGIWRSSGNADAFHVRLMELPDEFATEFRDVVSDGPWRAEIVGQDGKAVPSSWYTLTPEGESEQGPDGTIVGKDRTTIKFQYKPNGTIGANQVRCGIIRVYYNNYTCVHLIHVRQGYAPLQITPGSSLRWHTMNVASLSGPINNFTAHEVTDPRDEGAYFKWKNPAGIKASNNRTYGFGTAPGNAALELTDGTTSTWGNLKNGGTTNWSLNTTDTRVAREDDYQQLQYDEHTNPNMQYGFGVLYADGATQTMTTTDEAFGYYSDQAGSATKGMRGCFVYNNAEGDVAYGNNVFFPIGAEGYGRRKVGSSGVLRYAGRDALYTTSGEIEHRPQFFDIYRQKGAVYWCRNYDSVNKNSAWDINFTTFNFDHYLLNAGGGAVDSDACLIRIVSY